MKRLMNCVAAFWLLFNLQCKAQGHVSLAGTRNYKMRIDAQKDLKIKRNERKYNGALASRAMKKAKGSMDVVIVLRREKKADAERRNERMQKKQ